MNKNLKHDNECLFETKAIHTGQEATQWKCQAVIPPIFMTTTFQQNQPDSNPEYVYGRSKNPTRTCLEKCIADLEDAKYALTFASGLATQLTIVALLNAGEHILAGDELYGGTVRQFRCLTAFDFKIDYVDFCQVDNVLAAIKENTKLVWFETPTNPLLKIADIKNICLEVKTKYPNIIIVVDNTFMSPYFQKPLNFGADISMNSATKYMNGHSDVIMGCISTNNEKLYERLQFLQKSIGAVPSPFDCFLVNRSLKTLAIRMQQHNKNALIISKFLQEHPLIEKVMYPGLESHPGHEIMKKQCQGFGGMISFRIKGTIDNAKKFLSNLKIITLAESLGGVESLIEIPSLMTHSSVPKEIRESLGIFDTLVRLSVGIENIDDLINDLNQALKNSDLK